MNASYWLLSLALLITISFGGGTPSVLPSEQNAPGAGTINDVSANVDFIGNPFDTRFPDRLAYDRNVWDMAVYNGRLYLGHGNSNNEGVGGDPGPIDVWYYDDKSDSFKTDETVDDEQIDQFITIGSSLFIPGHDSTTSHANIYYLNGTQWTEWDNLPRALHVYDVHSYQGTLYVALGIGGGNDQVIAATSDNGATWKTYRLLVTQVPGLDLHIYRAWKFFEVGGTLLISIQPPYRFLPLSNTDGTIGNLFATAASPVYRLVNDSTQPHFEEMPADFFAGLAHPEKDWLEGRIARPVQFQNNTVYLGVKTVTDHNWTPFGLFSVDDSFNVSALPLADDLVPRDLLVDQNALYLLATQQRTNGSYLITVQETCDLKNWREVLQFPALTFSRSFMLYDGDFYFGQGTEEATASPQSGNIVRVAASHFSTACP